MKAVKPYKRKGEKVPVKRVVIRRARRIQRIRDRKRWCPNCGYYCTGKSVFCLPPILD